MAKLFNNYVRKEVACKYTHFGQSHQGDGITIQTQKHPTEKSVNWFFRDDHSDHFIGSLVPREVAEQLETLYQSLQKTFG